VRNCKRLIDRFDYDAMRLHSENCKPLVCVPCDRSRADKASLIPSVAKDLGHSARPHKILHCAQDDDYAVNGYACQTHGNLANPAKQGKIPVPFYLHRQRMRSKSDARSMHAMHRCRSLGLSVPLRPAIDDKLVCLDVGQSSHETVRLPP